MEKDIDDINIEDTDEDFVVSGLDDDDDEKMENELMNEDELEDEDEPEDEDEDEDEPEGEDEPEDELEQNKAISSVDNSTAVANTDKKYKILVGNGKAGIGKTTISSQLLAPFLFMQNDKNPINLYTLESAADNNLYSTFILNAVNVEVKENTFDNTMINIYSRDEHAIFDIGGGKTTSTVLNSLKNTGLVYGIDLFVIPLTDGQHEALKAKEFYDFIKSCNPSAKFLFVLNKVAANAQYDDVCLQYIDFLGDRNLMVDATRGIIEDVNEEDRNIAHLLDNDIIKYSVREQRTVFELAFTDISESERLLKEAIQNKDISKIRFLSARKNNIEKSKIFYNTCLNPAISKIESIVEE